MKKVFALAIAALRMSISSFAKDIKMVGGIAMYPARNMVENGLTQNTIPRWQLP